MTRTTFSGPVASDNGFTLPAYTVTAAPSPVYAVGTMIYTSNGLGGSPCVAVSNGTNWIAPNGSAISAT